MATRFGGKYSPDGEQGQDQALAPPAPRIGAGWQSAVLFIAPMPLVFRAFFDEPVGLALHLAAFGTLILAAWLTREGIKAQSAFEARRVARRPAIPRKIFGSVLTGAGLFVAGIAAGAGLLNPIIFAILGTTLHSFTFGFDPMSDKGMEGIGGFQSDRVARAVGKAQEHLDAMTDAIKRANNRKIEDRVARFQNTVREMFRTIEDDPRDLTSARKYLSVYLLGARDATVKFTDIYARSQDTLARDDYFALLDDLQDNFTARTEKMLLDDRSDLNIEIEVLRERLQREGISAGE